MYVCMCIYIYIYIYIYILCVCVCARLRVSRFKIFIRHIHNYTEYNQQGNVSVYICDPGPQSLNKGQFTEIEIYT